MISSRDRVIELLRTLEDARTDRSQGSGGGVIQMSVLYNNGSYQELERCLCEMRDTHKRERWHLMQRYVWGDPSKKRVVPSRKTRQGRIPILPDNSELRKIDWSASHELPGGLMVVHCYEWDEQVDHGYVERGLDVLTRLMYGGDSSRIILPEPFYKRLIEGGADVREPRQSYVPRVSLPAA